MPTTIQMLHEISSRLKVALKRFAFEPTSSAGLVIPIPMSVCDPLLSYGEALAIALTKYGITYFSATPALWEQTNSCAYFCEASSGK
jgi:hypothetical protein